MIGCILKQGEMNLENRRTRKNDRRKFERRKRKIHCILCGNELVHYKGDVPKDKEIFWCEICEQMYMLAAQHMEIPYLSKIDSWGNKNEVKERNDSK
jgi:transcription elongation factor Elf1